MEEQELKETQDQKPPLLVIRFSDNEHLESQLTPRVSVEISHEDFFLM